MKILPKSITKFNRDLLPIDGRSVFNHFNLGFYDKSLSKNLGRRRLPRRKLLFQTPE